MIDCQPRCVSAIPLPHSPLGFEHTFGCAVYLCSEHGQHLLRPQASRNPLGFTATARTRLAGHTVAYNLQISALMHEDSAYCLADISVHPSICYYGPNALTTH